MHAMNDLVVVLPGIGGSSLYRGEELIWDVCEGALWPLFRDRRLLNEKLKVSDNVLSPQAERVEARAIISGINGIFGLGKVDGYHTLRNAITENFEVRQGKVSSPNADENFFEFPYDWRKSNIESAHSLKKFIEHQLSAWQKWSHWKNARVILLAHSMGGLVSRYFLEALGGWRYCRALITFGTPFRGSVNALEYLTNGFSKLDFDLSEALRSMQSVYELLPIYPAVKSEGKWHRVGELGSLPPQLNRRRARAGLAFHRTIERKVKSNRRNPEYLSRGYVTYCVVGVNQPTLQSSKFDGAILTSADILPPIVSEFMQAGDGTVPRVSATPIEQGPYFHALHFVENHSSLQANKYVLDDLCARLQQLQVSADAPPVRGGDDMQTTPPVALAVSMDDVYFTSEPIIIRAALTPENAHPPALYAKIFSMDNVEIAECEFTVEPGSLVGKVESLPPGAYRVTVMAKSKVGGPPPVHNVFEVASDDLVRGQ